MAERRMMRRELRAANPSVRAERELAMMIRKQKVKTFLGWGTVSMIGGELAGMGPVSLLVGLMVGGTAAFFSEEIETFAQDWVPRRLTQGRAVLPLLHQTVVEAATDEELQDEQEPDELDEEELDELEDDDIYRQETARDTGGVARITVDDIVAHVQPNSYKIFIGRSLTKPKHPAVQISIYKQHFRFMGASQKGKSSMVAAFLDIVTRTHDYKHVRIALLDKEDQTSNLFGHLPHVATIRKDGQRLKLHARNDDQVLEYLIYVVEIMEYRYKLPKHQVLELPILLVYIEEFLDLKNTFKSRINQAKGNEAKEQAKSDYVTLVYCIEVLSQRGLKARVQLLLCAQVEYADDDFKEAMVNIGCGFSFCVRPTAAQAAGFKNNELLKRNAKENKVGQAVVETPDCNDLVLAPDYDLEQRILAFERDHPDIHPVQPVNDEAMTPAPIYRNGPDVNAEMAIYNDVNGPVNGSTSGVMTNDQKLHLHLLVNEQAERETGEEAPVNGNVNEDVKDIIKRLANQKVKHHVIAKAVKLDGRNYHIYRQICRELGIVIDKEA